VSSRDLSKTNEVYSNADRVDHFEGLWLGSLGTAVLK